MINYWNNLQRFLTTWNLQSMSVFILTHVALAQMLFRLHAQITVWKLCYAGGQAKWSLWPLLSLKYINLVCRRDTSLLLTEQNNAVFFHVNHSPSKCTISSIQLYCFRTLLLTSVKRHVTSTVTYQHFFCFRERAIIFIHVLPTRKIEALIFYISKYFFKHQVGFTTSSEGREMLSLFHWQDVLSHLKLPWQSSKRQNRAYYSCFH